MRQGFSAVHIGMVVATLWILMLNGMVGYQLLDDGTPLSLGLIVISALLLFIGTGYIALDTGFSWTGHWDPSLNDPNRNYPLYTLYQLAPLVFLFVYFVLETFLVIRILGEVKPMSKFEYIHELLSPLTICQSILLLQHSSLRLARFSST